MSSSNNGGGSSTDAQQQQVVKPTCKAVTRPGGRGARIHPKGCKIRNRVQANGTVGKEPKAGRLKPEKLRVVSSRNYYLQVARGNGRVYTKMLWDTGATVTVMSYTTAKRIGILTKDGNLRPGLRYGEDARVVIASGERVTVKSIVDVPLKIQRTGEIVSGKVYLLRSGSSLFGISHIKNVKTLKVKYR